MLAYRNDLVTFAWHKRAGITTYQWIPSENRYQEKSHVRYRSYKTAWVDKMKEDLFDPTQILVQIKGQINRVKIDYLLDEKRKDQKHECHAAEQIYHSTCWDHNLDDFRQMSPFLLAIIAK
jgi:esterase/lipase